MDGIALGCLTALFSAKVCLSRGKLLVLGAVGTMMLVFVVGFSIRVDHWGLGRDGLDMTILALGACLILVAVAQTRWRVPGIAGPLTRLGRLSYEVYLTHIFVVLSVFHLVLFMNKPVRAVPEMFLVVLLLSGLLGEVVSRSYSEPMNRWLRGRWVKDTTRPSSVDRAEVMSV
jgi:peptidoglycan/LPS O-acetylase OafA/YrhL